MVIAPEDEYLFITVCAWATATCGLLFLGITSYSAKMGKKQLDAPLERTKKILASRNIPYYLLDKLPIFRIGGDAAFCPQTTLALLPYCARGPRCQIRLDNEKQAADVPISGDQCNRCQPLCPIGKLINYENIAEIRIIGSHHDLNGAVEKFLKDHERLTHVVAVCCTSRFAKYLSKFVDTGNKGFGVTVIYTPLLTGADTCLSSTDIKHKGRAESTLPLTSFNAAALITGLERMLKNKLPSVYCQDNKKQKTNAPHDVSPIAVQGLSNKVQRRSPKGENSRKE